MEAETYIDWLAYQTGGREEKSSMSSTPCQEVHDAGILRMAHHSSAPHRVLDYEEVVQLKYGIETLPQAEMEKDKV